MQAECKVKWVRQRRLEEGASSKVRILFIPAAVAEGRLLVKGYLWRLFYGVNTRYSLYKMKQSLETVAGVITCDTSIIRIVD